MSSTLAAPVRPGDNTETAAGDRLPSATPRSRWLIRQPARPIASDWPMTTCDRCEAARVVLAASSALPDSRVHGDKRRGIPLLLDWLAEHPGDTWQQRWIASGADDAGLHWASSPARWLQGQGRYSQSQLDLMTSSLLLTVGADLIRPSLSWLLTGGRKRKLAQNMIRSGDRDGFDRLQALCESDSAITPHAQGQTLFRAAVVIAAKGGLLADLTIGDVLEVLDTELALRGQTRGGSATFRMLRELGIFGQGVPTLREIRSSGQRTVEELIDRYPIACRPVRGLLVDYLKERQPAVNYVTLRGLSYQLARRFWLDLEHHHPGIDSLRLPREVASAWKHRLHPQQDQHDRRWGKGRTDRGAAQLPRHAGYGPGLLPRFGRVGPGGPQPLGDAERPSPHSTANITKIG